MKMLSLDIETTGLDPKVHGTIQLGGIMFDAKAAVGTSIRQFELDIEFDNLVWSSYCLKLHKDWITKNLERTDLMSRGAALSHFLAQFPITEKTVLVGKNVHFDYAFINEMPNQFTKPLDEIFDHRFVNPAHWYTHSSDNKPPGLSTCKRRAMDEGCKAWDSDTVAHTALADAYDVMILTQWAYKEGKVANA